MIEWIKRVIFARKYKRAVKKAKELAELTGLRYFVIYLNGSLKVVPKRPSRNWFKNIVFARG